MSEDERLDLVRSTAEAHSGLKEIAFPRELNEVERMELAQLESRPRDDMKQLGIRVGRLEHVRDRDVADEIDDRPAALALRDIGELQPRQLPPS